MNEISKTTLNTNNNNLNSNNNNVSSNSNNDNVSSINSNSTVISQAAGKVNKQIYNNSNNHLKRPSNTNESSSKRAKSTNSQSELNVSLVSSRLAKPQSPQLLQQLMAPSQQTQKGRTKDGQRWSGNTGASKSIPLQQSSNSVLMNLLVSGCDVSAGYTCFPRPKVAKA